MLQNDERNLVAADGTFRLCAVGVTLSELSRQLRLLSASYIRNDLFRRHEMAEVSR